MTENSSENLTEDSFDLLSYIQSGTVARRQVTIYNDPEAGDQLMRLLDELRELGWSEDAEPDPDKVKDGPLSGSPNQSEIDDLLEQAEAAQARLEVSKSVWTVRALSPDEIEATFDVVPVPSMPTPPKDGVAQPIRDKYAQKFERYMKTKTQAEADRRLAIIATAVVSVETPRGAVDSVSLDTLKALRAKPQGQQWADRLYQAVEDAQGSDVDVPRPTSLGRSTSTQD